MISYQTMYAQQLAQEINNTPDEYLPMLLKLVHLFRQRITLKPAQESFRQGWQEVLTGETLPIETLWEGIDEDVKKETRKHSKIGKGCYRGGKGKSWRHRTKRLGKYSRP